MGTRTQVEAIMRLSKRRVSTSARQGRRRAPETHTAGLLLAGQLGTRFSGTEVRPAGELWPYLAAAPAGALRARGYAGAQDA